MFHLIDFTHLNDLLQLVQEEDLLDSIGKRPVLEKSFQQWDSQGSIFGQKQHGASKKLLVVLGASLDLMERDDDILE